MCVKAGDWRNGGNATANLYAISSTGGVYAIGTIIDAGSGDPARYKPVEPLRLTKGVERQSCPYAHRRAMSHALQRARIYLN